MADEVGRALGQRVEVALLDLRLRTRLKSRSEPMIRLQRKISSSIVFR